VTGGEAELWAAEGWGHSKVQLFDRLRPGETATATLAVRPSAKATLGLAVPAFVWFRMKPEDAGNAASPLAFQSSVDLLPVRPIEPRFTFGPRGTMTLHLTSRFPGRAFAGTVSLRTAEGRSFAGGELPFSMTNATALTFRQQLPETEAPDLRRTYATISVGSYRQLASAIDTATIQLKAENDEKGVEWLNWEDGRTEAVKGDLAPGRRAIPNAPGKGHYVYFNVADTLPTGGDTYVQVEYYDEQPGSLTLQYDSTDAAAPLEGRYKNAEAVPLTGSKSWQRHTWKLSDARFANRQNGGADFRLAVGPETVIVRRVTVSKWEFKK
jgi:hypothetical protein